MLALLVLVPWLCLIIALKKRVPDWRDAFLAGSVWWGVGVVAITETLSFFHQISFSPILAAWILFSCAAASATFVFRPLSTGRAPATQTVLGPSDRILLFAVAVICLATLFAVIIYPPNTDDSLTYHLTRVSKWIDFHSVNHYPTGMLRQLYLGPFAEFVILHLQILSGVDRYAGCVQWGAMVGSLIAVSRIAWKLGLGNKGQVLTVVFCATIPIGVFESASTQTDYVSAFWVISFLNFALDMIQGSSSKLHALLAGSALGLACLTKVSSLFFAAPFCLWLLIATWRRTAFLAPMLIAMSVPFLLLNAPHDYRNWSVFGTILAPPEHAGQYENEVHSRQAFASNLIRNIAVHGYGNRFFIGDFIYASVNAFHRLIGWNVNDPRDTITGSTFAIGSILGEDTASNPVHLLLIAVAFIVCLRSAARRPIRIYALCVASGFAIFCLLLKWQPWISRLQLPWFVIAAPLCAIALSAPRLAKLQLPLAAILLAYAAFLVARNPNHRLAPVSAALLRDRTSLYFYCIPQMESSFRQAAAEIGAFPSPRIGLVSGEAGQEYPLRLLIRRVSPAAQFSQLEVQNNSVKLQPPASTEARPNDFIIVLDVPASPATLNGYRPALVTPYIAVYRRA